MIIQEYCITYIYIEQLNDKGVSFVSIKEAIDTTTPTGMFMLTMIKQGNISGVDVMKILQLKKTTFYKLIVKQAEEG